MGLFNTIAAELESLVLASPSGKTPGLSLDQRHQGVNTPAVRKLAKRFSKEFVSLSWDGQTSIVQELLEYGTNRAAHLGVFLLGYSIRNADSVDARALDAMVNAFRGWSVTDAFCIEVLQPLLEKYPRAVLALTGKWALADCQWKRRASVVVFVRKVGASGEYTQEGLAACERLVFDPEDLVRKGVGWALKDLMRGDRETVLAYVAGLRERGVSAVITLYAVRDIKGEERKRVLAVKNRKG